MRTTHGTGKPLYTGQPAAVEWLTYGSGWLAGMKLGDTPLVDFTRDRLHRETLRSFGRYELTTAYTPAGQLQTSAPEQPAGMTAITPGTTTANSSASAARAPDPELRLQHQRG
ncbi:hypothetical protein ACNKHU_24795 [Shigella flexneri]